MQSMPEARPSPLICSGDEIRSQSVSFDVAADGEEVFVALHGERLESALVEWSFPGGSMSGMPSLRMRDGHPSHEFGQIVVCSAFWPEHQVPVIRHHGVGRLILILGIVQADCLRLG